MRRAVFLDRDGVLVQERVRDNRAFAPTRLEDFRVVPEAAVQVGRLRAAGLCCIVFTNQPEVARGLLPPQVLEAMHAELCATVGLDDVYVCPHDDRDACVCRKPRAGMLLEAADKWSLSLGESFVIGDRWRDIEAGRSVGAFSVLLTRPYSDCATADLEVNDLSGAVDAVLARLEVHDGLHRALPR